MGLGDRPAPSHLLSTRPHHRFIAIFLFSALCLTIVVTVVWKTTSKTSPVAALDTDCHEQVSSDAVHGSGPEQVVSGAGCHEQPSTDRTHNGLQYLTDRHEPPDTSPAVAETIVYTEEKERIEQVPKAISGGSDVVALDAKQMGILERGIDPTVPSDTVDVVETEEDLPKDRSERVPKAISGDSDVALDAKQMKILELGIDPTIPSYAVDEHGRPHEWVLRGPDMFDKVCLYDKDSGNLPSRRFTWFAHMNRKDETSSLYNQLDIDQSCSESWVPTAIKTAKEIRRVIMAYFVFYEVNALECDLGPWDRIKCNAPGNVQHRMQVFIAKLEYLKPFHYLRKVTQNVCDEPYPFGYYIEYFQYRHELESWLQKYEHLRQEVAELSFEGCTRTFQIADDPDRATKFIVKTLDLNLKRLNDLTAIGIGPVPLLIHLCMKASRTGYEMLDRLQEPIQESLKQLRQMKITRDNQAGYVQYPDIP